MTTFTLLIWIYAGVFAKGDSMALDHIDGFQSKVSCEQAANGLKNITNNTVKEIVTACVEKK
jgi:hypothetical protein